MEILIVSGMSGAGKSHVAKILEDSGFYCVDNMPVELIPHFADMCLASHDRYDRVALVTDIRIGQNFDALFASLDLIRAMNCPYKILFVEARPDAIIRRYKETRRGHPLATSGESIEQAIELENTLLLPIRAKADFVIDTSTLSTSALREHLQRLFSEVSRRPMVVRVMSFGFKHGLPPDADLVFDVRFLPNPYHIPDLREFSGLNDCVRDFVFKWPQTNDFLIKLKNMIDFLLPQYIQEGKSGLVIAIGCTGGRHRSVAIAHDLYDDLQSKDYHAILSDRDISKS